MVNIFLLNNYYSYNNNFSSIYILQMKGLRRNEDAMKTNAGIKKILYRELFLCRCGLKLFVLCADKCG